MFSGRCGARLAGSCCSSRRHLASAEWTVEKTRRRRSRQTRRQTGDRVSHPLGHQADPLAAESVPTESPFTRAYPMEKVPAKQNDHPHQRSCWFTHGNVNGIDFWAEPGTVAAAATSARSSIRSSSRSKGAPTKR